ncbi:MAG: protein kinase, partial [Myxococcales bacterium]|nr:protein kinase [Myxococcales bacterium]
MTARPHLGPFRLDELLGQGGMGQVWAARHAAEAWPVAIKVITADISRQPGYQRAFRREVRAVARLDHPGIVRVHDFGQIADEAPAPLPAGSPFLVMDRLDGGALSPDLPGLDWPGLRAAVMDLLDALGHAHARGVIHRDL